MGRIPRFLKWAAGCERHAGKQQQSFLGLPRYHRRLACEALETRRLLSVVPQLPAGWQATPIADPIYFSTADASGSTTPLGLTPNQIRGAYGLGSYTSGVLSNGISFAGIPGDGRGQTIAIVDAYDDPNAASDLNAFSSTFGLPTFNAGAGSPTFQKLNQDGQTSPLPSTDLYGPFQSTGFNDWEQEESLDIEWAHVMAPLANIILLEANSDGNDLYTVVQAAASTPGVDVVSMSWGGTEFSSESTYDATYFTTPPGHVGGSATLGGAGLAGGVTFLASTGDNGAFAEDSSTITSQYPACSPNVVAVGGTTLSVSGSNPNYTYNGETAWGSGVDSGFTGGGGGGISEYESQPVYQNGVVSAFSTTHRTYPDISADADPDSGVPIYDSWDFGASTPWLSGTEGGTSLACPMWAGIIAVADEGRAIAGEGSLDGPSQTLPMLYNLPAADFHDITSGDNGYAAGPGYDLATGIGSPVGNLLIPALIGQTLTVTNNLDDNSAGSLRYEISQAGPGDVIQFAGNLDGQSITLANGPLSISQYLAIEGPGADQLTIDGNQTSTVFDIAANVTDSISGLTIADGKTSGDGGGIDDEGDLTVTNCTFSGNTAGDTGGGIFVDGNNGAILAVSGSTFSGNDAGTTGGGGIGYPGIGGMLTVTNCTFSENTAVLGGGIYADDGTLAVQDSTIAGNTASNFCGGLYADFSNATLTNTIVAQNSNGSDADDMFGFLIANNCLIGNTTDSSATVFLSGSGGNIVNTDPLLGQLGNYGGSTETLPLLSDSPAIDAGSVALVPSWLTTDQRGLPRTVTVNGNAEVDIGAFEYQPVVTNINPATGTTAGGTPVTITGIDLTAATAVDFGSAAGKITSDTADQIVATSPAGSGMVDVTVVTANGTSATSSNDQFTYVVVPQAPVLTGISPASGLPAGGTVVTITGTSFNGATLVDFGANAATNVAISSDGTQITATSPKGTGTVNVRVTTALGTSPTSPADQFSYVAAPVVASVSPAAGPAAGGTTVTITGSGFTGATLVDFGAKAATIVAISSDGTQITVTDPAGKGAGVVGVTVTTPSGTSPLSAADEFSYAPVVTRISVPAGPLAGGTKETITGTNFTGATAVYFGATKATKLKVDSATQITATIPKGAAGLVDVTITSAGGTSATSTADQFTYVAAPMITTAISPASGPKGGGTSVTITGSNLGTAATATVRFGKAMATIISDTGSQIVVNSPKGKAGKVNVTVTTVGGTSKTSSADKFTYVAMNGKIAAAANDLAILAWTNPSGTSATLQRKIAVNLLASLSS